MIEIILTYVPRDSDDLAAGARMIRSFAKSIHIDIDDALLAPHLTWPYTAPGVFSDVDLTPTKGLFAEIHLMVKDANDIGVVFARAGAKRIIGHLEGFRDMNAARAALHAWREAGALEVGLGLLFQTPLAGLEHIVEECDVVHLMSIATIGVQGIPYVPTAPARIAEFHQRFPGATISVDGGVSRSNIVDLARAGARRFGVGSAILKAPDPEAAYQELKTLAENAVK